MRRLLLALVLVAFAAPAPFVSARDAARDACKEACGIQQEQQIKQEKSLKAAEDEAAKYLAPVSGEKRR